MKRLILLGAGHAHALVLRAWCGAPPPDTEIVVISPTPLAPYSGMVPGWLTDHYRFEDICVDFAPLCAATGARLVRGDAVGLDPAAHLLRLADGSEMAYDLLSINIGSTLYPPDAAGPRVLSLRPLGSLREAWEALLASPPQGLPGQPLRVTAVGGGAAGVESLLAVSARLQGLGMAVRPRLVSRGARLLPGMAPGAARRVLRLFQQRGITCQTDTDYGPAIGAETDLLLWAAGAQPQAFHQRCGLALSEAGFIRIDPCLRSLSHAEVFAVGDCAEWPQPLPKAGVFPVRLGPVLARNLGLALAGAQLPPHQTALRFLALLATADGSAVASWNGWSLQGRWVWRWKDRIDRAFLARVAAPELA